MANECRCCSEVGPKVGKLGFDAETISCITKHGGYKAIMHEEVLKLTGPMLRDKNGRSYKRKAGQSERQYVYFSAYIDQLRFKTILNLDFIGGGKKRKRICAGEVSASTLPQDKRALLESPRDDRNMCCAEALWTAYKRATLSDREFQAQYHLSMRKRRPFQSKCESFQREVGIELGTLCGPEELERFAAYFGREVGYYIVVIDADRGRQAYRYGHGNSENKVLGLLYRANHYDVIRSFTGLFNSHHYCFYCLNPYQNEGLHRCSKNEDHCPRCLQDGCEDYVRYRQSPAQTNNRE